MPIGTEHLEEGIAFESGYYAKSTNAIIVFSDGRADKITILVPDETRPAPTLEDGSIDIPGVRIGRPGDKKSSTTPKKDTV